MHFARSDHRSKYKHSVGRGAGECAAGSSSGSDTINFSVTGTITVTLVNSSTGRIEVLPDITSDMTINGPGTSHLTVSGNKRVRVFDIVVATPGVVSFSGLTIADGDPNGQVLFGGGCGGGIRNQSTGTVNINNSALTGNHASLQQTNPVGGGICNSGSINVTNSTLTNNGSRNGGGAIYGGVVNVTNSTISGNSTSIGDGGGIGGAQVDVTNSTLSGNSAETGGGIANPGAIVNITNSTITNNHATKGGGGIGNLGNGTVNVINSTVSNNTASFSTGGGIANLSTGTVRVTNSTISDNLATLALGGGISGSAQLRNTIVARNTTTGPGSQPGGGPDLNGSFTTQGHNLIGIIDNNNTGFTAGTNNANGDLVGTTNSPIDPKVGSLADNGGPTQTLALLPGSPAFDAGDNCVTEAAHCGDPNITQLLTDQRGPGFSRSIDGPDADTTAAVDIGAFEAQVSVEDIPDKTINEDTQLQLAFNLGGIVTSITATSSNAALIPNNAANIALSGAGSTPTLRINSLANEFGTSTITITVNGPNSQSMTDTFLLTVNSVNDQPSFTEGPDQTVSNNAGSQTINNWATNISPGPANESSQTLAFIVTANSNPSLFTSAPAISAAGTLTYQFAPSAGGKAMITVVLQDSGGTANGGVDTSLPQTFTINVVPLGGFISFSSDTYNTAESSGFVTTTLKRTGDLSRAVTVDYATSADNGLPCSTANGVATPKCDFTTALGTLNFAAAETTKTVTILISQDAFVEGPETFSLLLSNPTAGAALAMPSAATITIADDVTEPPTNPVDDARNFVRQHYHDFLNREPDASGWDFWTSQIASCASDSECIEVRRINVSASFFLSIEFQQTGYIVERFYKVGYGDATGTSNFQFNHQLPVPMVRFNEFLKDTQRIGQGVVVLQPGWEQALENNKQAYALEFVQTSRFMAALPTTLSPDQFVDRLNQNTGGVLTLSERTAVINLFGGAANTTNVTARAQALRMVADDTDLYSAEFNRAFVLAEYFGYLRRNPSDAPETTMDYTGYDFWVTKLNQFNGNYINSEMVKAFLSSTEYRQRFGP